MRCRDKVHYPTEERARAVLLQRVLNPNTDRGYTPVAVSACGCDRGGWVLTSRSTKTYAKGKGKNKAYGYQQRSKKRRSR